MPYRLVQHCEYHKLAVDSFVYVPFSKTAAGPCDMAYKKFLKKFLDCKTS